MCLSCQSLCALVKAFVTRSQSPPALQGPSQVPSPSFSYSHCPPQLFAGVSPPLGAHGACHGMPSDYQVPDCQYQVTTPRRQLCLNLTSDLAKHPAFGKRPVNDYGQKSRKRIKQLFCFAASTLNNATLTLLTEANVYTLWFGKCMPVDLKLFYPDLGIKKDF